MTTNPEVQTKNTPSARSRALLWCGAASTLLYVAMDACAAARYKGYSYRDQTISELSAVGAPTRSLWLPLGYLYGLLVALGSFGIWLHAAGRCSVRLVAGLLAAMSVLSLAAWPLAPMHRREVLAAGGGTRSDTAHLVLSGVNTLIFVLMIVVGGASRGRRFRRYSATTLGAVAIAGAMTGRDAPKVSANEPTPWLGIKERIAVLGSMLWISAFSLALLQERSPESPRSTNDVAEVP